MSDSRYRMSGITAEDLLYDSRLSRSRISEPRAVRNDVLLAVLPDPISLRDWGGEGNYGALKLSVRDLYTTLASQSL